jgi:hypothetical protein
MVHLFYINFNRRLAGVFKKRGNGKRGWLLRWALPLLLGGALFLSGSCKTCKCPAYTYHEASERGAESEEWAVAAYRGGSK